MSRRLKKSQITLRLLRFLTTLNREILRQAIIFELPAGEITKYTWDKLRKHSD